MVEDDKRSPQERRTLRDFGYRVRQVREARGLTQMKVAHAAGMTVSYVGQIEQGRRNVALLNIQALAKALGVTPGELLDPPRKPSGS